MSDTQTLGTTKRCSKCGQLRSAADFSRDRRARDGMHCICQPCRRVRARAKYKAQNEIRERYRRAHIRRTYDLTPAQYDAMVAAQNGACAICCNRLETGRGTNVDHCHVTGRVRSILCMTCNIAIGGARDDPALLRAMADYVEQHRATPAAT